VLRSCRMRCCVGLFFCLGVASGQPLPKFSDYTTTVRRPANFAGHYELLAKPCPDQASSTEITIKDALSGIAYSGGCYWWGYGAYGRKGLPHGIKYRANSSLFIVSGCREVTERACGTFYYALKNNGLVLLRLIPFKRPIVLE